jgi:uncharacterized protein (TIGR01777 family)
MKIVMTGGTGQIGAILARHYLTQEHDVVVIGRNIKPQPWRMVLWDGETGSAWMREMNDADVVINLAGRSVNCRYSDENRREIVESRVRSTLAVGNAIANASRPPRLWLQASTATIYAHRYDAPNDEFTGVLGGDEPDVPETWRFSIDVAQAWEAALDSCKTPHTRKVKLRSAMVMSPDRGGVFDVFSGLVRRGLGGQMGDGRQFVSWIHDQDFARALDWLMAHEDLADAVNLAAPNPITNAQFMEMLRKAWGAKFGLGSTAWMLEVGAWAMRTETELILKSRRVVPSKLLASGFAFRFPTWEQAAADLAKRWRR